ncbi:SagB/ThcOx family dehydrogenase [Pseudaminobacter arsenicus]|uniref:SagB/ThcOx family dehydrogenase n=1 Tax=Borborobacter arsenicus TaxID=1851146 RepID=A0A432V1N3_9HYPH|nr:nitroreductase family protein [Pseudaminobacter arsenicus]RUM95962.1 SagB/ThcOx family dehydrogenase [Pseudaminobacter arsenicus]
MQGLTRRLFLASATLASGLVSRASLAGGSGLPPAATTADGSLIDALSRRRSTRLYSDQSIDAATLSTLLWFGINRPESAGHTASSWHTSMEADIYVADVGGVGKFDPATHRLLPVLAEDIRGKASLQPFVGTAPLVLVNIADRARNEEQIQAAHVDAAIIPENVYLNCASVGLGTCLVGGADKAGLTQILKLPDSQMVTFSQPVGYLKQAA